MPTVPPSNPLLLLCSPNPPVPKQRTSSPRAPPVPHHQPPHALTCALFPFTHGPGGHYGGSQAAGRSPGPRSGVDGTADGVSWCPHRVQNTETRETKNSTRHPLQGRARMVCVCWGGEGFGAELGTNSLYFPLGLQDLLSPSPPAPPPRCPFPHPGRPL